MDRARLRAKRALLQNHAFLMRTASGWRERLGVLRFWLRQGARLAGRRSRSDARVRYGGATYVVDQSVELHTLAEFHRDGFYSAHAAFGPTAGTTVVDVGANVGVFALHHALAGARVHAIEPNPSAFRRLDEAVRLNRVEDRVTTAHAAVGAAEGSGVIDAPGGLTVLGAVRAAAPGATAADRVPIRRLDDMLSEAGIAEIDLLKIDVEGAELDVVAGGHAALDATRRVILEFHSPELLAAGRAMLAEHGLREVASVQTETPGVSMFYAARV